MLRRINDVLPELMFQIIIYGFLVQVVGVWFVSDKVGYSIGLWIGIIIAVGMVIHMGIVIRDAVDMVIEKQARIRTTIFSILRYIVVVGLFGVVIYFKIGNVITMFIGVMGLKVAAYLQPFTHKFFTKEKKRGSGVSTDL